MTVQIGLRFPDDLHGRLKTVAEADMRSLHSEIIWLLEEALAAREETSQDAASNGAGS
ncbi:MAG: Arc family DNA-binding protein [Nocardioidaceae bacterium]